MPQFLGFFPKLSVPFNLGFIWFYPECLCRALAVALLLGGFFVVLAVALLPGGFFSVLAVALLPGGLFQCPC